MLTREERTVEVFYCFGILYLEENIQSSDLITIVSIVMLSFEK